MLLGKVAAPAEVYWKSWPPLYEQALNNNLTFFFTQPGYFWSDGLMAMLNEHSRTACWLRLEPEDQDPAGLLLSLIAAARRIDPEAGTQTLAAMRLSPGSAVGWEPLYAHLGQELVERLPGNCVLVLEHLHQISQSGPSVDYLLRSFLPWVTRRFPSLLTSQKPFSLTGLPGTAVEHRLEDLRLDFPSASAMFQGVRCALGEEYIWKALQTFEGRAVAFAGLCSASKMLEADYLETAIQEAKDAGQLFTRLAQSILRLGRPEASQALAVASRLTYAHPDLVLAALGTEIPLTGPWLQSLSDGWMLFQQIWGASLQPLLQAPEESLQTALLHAADYLFSQGAVPWSIRIYFECGAMDSAARAIAGVLDHYLDLGLWQSLDSWLKRLPSEVLEEWPRLVYTLGEVEALNGEAGKARAAFISAGQLFANRQDMDGFCQSKLAESALAIQQDDHDQAWSSALAASALAARFGLRRQGNWANWQLGRLAAASDRLDDALAFFAQVKQDERDPIFDPLFDKAEVLAQDLQETKRQRETHRQAFLDLQKVEQETAHRLNQLMSASLPQVKGALGVQAWSQIHPVLKFSGLSNGDSGREYERSHLWGKFFRALGLNKPFTKTSKNKPGQAAGQLQLELPLFQSVLFLPQQAPGPAAGEPLEAIGQQEEDTRPEASAELPIPRSDNLPLVEPDAKPSARDSTPALAIHCLGPFQVFQNDLLLENWPLRKALAIFKYLVAQRQNFVSKEILMDTFWPEADPEAARRNLHQAIYSLRQSLHLDGSDFQYIVFINDRYRLNPDLEVWSDDDDFVQHYTAGSQLEKSGQLEQAIREYEIAVDLYRGNFMAEDLYEDWPTSRRDYLWQLYLVMMYRLVEFYASRKEYSISAGFCQRIIYLDDCQEEAYLNLMKCYLEQGKRNQAIQQFYLCRQALRAKLNLSPTAEMQELYRQIMKR